MKTRFTLLLFLLSTIFFNQAIFAQNDGDYRSNVVTTGLWSAASSWERYDGVTLFAWVAAVAPPTSGDGVITIRSGDSIRLNSSITIDEVVIEGAAGAGNQGVLAIFLTGGPVTLNNPVSPVGDDIIVNAFGRLYIAAGTTVSGTGTIYVNPGGLFTLRNSGILSVPVTSDGDINFGQPAVSAGTITGATVTSNNTATWIDGILLINSGGNLTNNGTMTVNADDALNVATGGTVTNTGTILKTSTGGTWFPVITNSGTISSSGTVTYASMINSSTGIITGSATQTFSAITNSGTLAGTGTFNYPAGGTNTGSVAPGNSPGTLTVNPNTLVGTTATVRIEILDGTGAGTGHDELLVTGATNMNGVTINVIDISPVITPAPIQSYTIMQTTAGNFSGTPTFNMPTNYSVVSSLPLTGNTIVIQKNALFPLPLVWGDFTALVKNSNQVQLKWSTIQEQNVSHFTLEHSTDGINYIPIGSVTAAGTTFERRDYSFLHTAPDLQKSNYYRIKQTDLDAKSTYSVVRPVRFNKGNVVAVLATPNPVKDVLQLSVQTDGVRILLSDMSGKVYQSLELKPGVHSINMERMHSGMYQLTIYEKGERLETQKILKL